MNDLISVLSSIFKGKKSYFVALLMGVATFAFANGWLEVQQFLVIMGALNSGAVAAIRAGIGPGITGVQEK